MKFTTGLIGKSDLCNKIIKFKLESGAQTIYFQLIHFKIRFTYYTFNESKINITSITGGKTAVVGKCDLDCNYNKKLFCITFLIINVNCVLILGLKQLLV